MLGGDTVVPSGLYARLCHAFSSLSSFLMISQRQIISRSAEPIFTIFTSNESFLGVDDRSGPLFSISQGTLKRHPILCKNGVKLPTLLHLSLWHSETVWDIATSMGALTAQMMPVYRVKIS